MESTPSKVEAYAYVHSKKEIQHSIIYSMILRKNFNTDYLPSPAASGCWRTEEIFWRQWHKIS